jgi:ribosomal protein S3
LACRRLSGGPSVGGCRTEIIIRATRTQNVLGEKGRRIRELTSVVQKRFSFPEGSVELYAEKVANRGLCAVAQAESLRYKLVGGLAVRVRTPCSASGDWRIRRVGGAATQVEGLAARSAT